MNSEVPPIPESDYSKSDQRSDSADSMEQLEELEVESTSETTPDAWLEEDIIDVDVQPEAESEVSKPESSPASPPKLTTDQLPEVPEVGDLSGVDIALDNSTQPPEKSAPEKSTGSESTESELFVDSWLDEAESDAPASDPVEQDITVPQDDEISQLEQQKASLQGEIVALQAQKEQILATQVDEIQASLGRMIDEGTRELRERKTALQIEIEKLERRKERINQEMRTNFAGSSQELAIKVQGFKNYLVGSLQDLARAADKLELAKSDVSSIRNRSPRSRDAKEDDWGEARVRNRGDRDSRDSRNIRDARDSRGSRGSRVSRDPRGARDRNPSATAPPGQFSESTFADQGRHIRQLIDKYRNNPDYYGSPWQLRRTFEPIHAKKVQDWFFVQGGRGAVDSMGSRLQNILVASAIVSILHSLYGDRCRILVLTDTPENLGEWRRGLQDCLGISRSNFGSNRGVTLFDAPEVVVQRAERLIADKLLPLIIIDETEELLNLSVLKFPLWLAFASSAKSASSNYLY